jgi:hypothetical protein
MTAFGAGVEGFGLFMTADAVPQTPTIVTAAKARGIGNERRIFWSPVLFAGLRPELD